MNAPTELPIAETFHSVQGEGKLAGTPSYFVRFSGCNLRCRWCDTPYASWNPETATRTIDSIVEESARATHAVITGGEPMIFAPVETLAARLRDAGAHVTIETAGTVFRPGLACDLMSISPKLANSTPHTGDPRDPSGEWHRRHEQRRINPDTLQSLIDAYPQRQLKFVVTAPDDLPEIDSLLARLRNWSADDVLLMPEGVAVAPPETRDWITRECARRAWRYGPRLHIELFGNRRGT